MKLDRTARLIAAVAILVAYSAPPALAADKPDLVVIGLSNPPASRTQGTKFEISDTVKNKGQARAGGSSNAYYLSSDKTKGPGDKKLQGQRAVGQLNPGISSQGSKKVRVPLTTPVGKYFVIACADSKNEVNEGNNEDNNCKSSEAKLRVKAPDTTAPAAPTLTGTNPSSPGNENAPHVIGTAEPNSSISLYKDVACTGAPAETGVASAAGAFDIEASVPDNSTTSFRVTATDAASNVSVCSSSVTYVEDSAAPSQPTITQTNPSSPSNDNNPKIKGTAEADSQVRVFKNADCTGTPDETGTAAAFADPGITLPVPSDTSTAISVNARDAAGNTSSCSNSLNYAEDSTPPVTPTITGPSSPANDNNPELTGTADAGTDVKVYTTSDCSGTHVASGSAGDFTTTGFTVSVTDDTATTFRATSTDSVQNESACSGPLVYIEDSTPPGAPTITGPSSPANDNAPELTGTAEGGSTVKVYTTSDCSGDPVASGSAGDFASPGLTVNVANGTSTIFRATGTDSAGNPSACSDPFTYVESTPAPPVITGSDPPSPSSSNTPKIIGTAEIGSTVNLYTSTDCSGSPVISGNASEFASPGLATSVAANTTTIFSAQAVNGTDISTCSAPFTYVEDSSPPPAPTALTTVPVSPANDNSPEIKGTAQSGSTVKIYAVTSAAGGCVATDNPTLLATGSAAIFSSTGITVAVPDNATTLIKASATDAASNVSSCSATLTYQEQSPPVESEPNDAFGQANPLTGVTPHSNGSIDPVDDVDFYSVVVPAGGSIRAETTGEFGSTASCPGTVLTLYDTNGTSVLATNSAACSLIDGAGGLTEAAPPHPAAGTLAAGTYFLKVEGSGSTIPAYRLRVAVGTAQPALEVESNNTVAEADARASGDGVEFTGNGSRKGTLPLSDDDIFRVNLASASVVRAETFDATGRDCRSAAGPTMTVMLLNSAGGVFKTDTTTPGIGVCGAITAALPAGVSYIQVEENGRNVAIEQYRLHLQLHTDLGTHGEGNDTIGTATPKPGSDVVISGDHEVSTDQDVFSFTVTNGQSIRAEIIEGNGNLVETCEAGSIDSKITLLNADGAILGSDDDDGRGFCSLLDGTGLIPSDFGAHNLSAGTYYLRVESFSTAAGTASLFDYRLALTMR